MTAVSLKAQLSWRGTGGKEINRKFISIIWVRNYKVLIVETEGTEWAQGRIERLNEQDWMTDGRSCGKGRI